MDPVSSSPRRPETAADITLQGEIKKGRDWVVFIGQMVGRIDSPAALFQALSMGVGAILMIFPKALRCALLRLGVLKED